MQERIKEHDRDIPFAHTQTSAVSEHANKTGHHPLWNKVKFIDRDSHWYARRVKEAIHIRLHPDNAFVVALKMFILRSLKIRALTCVAKDMTSICLAERKTGGLGQVTTKKNPGITRPRPDGGVKHRHAVRVEPMTFCSTIW